MRSEIPKAAGQEPEGIEKIFCIILFCNGNGKSLQKVAGTGSNKFGKQVVQVVHIKVEASINNYTMLI